MAQDIELHIEQLVLHGFAGYNKYQIAQAVEQEITRLLQEGGFSGAHGQNINPEGFSAGTFTIQPDAKAEVIGKNIANSVYKPLQSE